MTYEHEEWRTIEGYPDYQVSNHGRIKSFRRGNGRILRPGKTDRGYLNVTLFSDAGYTTFTVHGLVAETFLGRRPANYDVNHRDGCKTNNAASNLEYTTRRENLRHANEVLGLNIRIQKLNEVEILSVIELINTPEVTLDAIAKQFNVSLSCVSRILNGTRYTEYYHLISQEVRQRRKTWNRHPAPTSDGDAS